MMTKQSHSIVVNTKPYRLSIDAGARETPQRRLGLGADCCSASSVQSLLRDAMKCPVTSIPVLEHTTLDIAGPDLDEEIVETFGSEIDFFNASKSIIGVDQVQTTFVHPGILQTGMIVVAVGFHIFAEPLCFTAEGNSITPAPAATQVSPASLDVFTAADLANLGLASGQTITPALLEWGWWAQYAAWHFINGYNFDWVVRQRYHVLSESARYIAHFSSFADETGSGTSQVPVLPFMARANQRYRQKSGNSTGIILPIALSRQGAFSQGGTEESVARGTRNYDTAPVTWGGLGLQHKHGNSPFRKLTLPYFIPGNTPIGLQLNQSDDVQANLFRQALSITDGIGASVPPIEYADQNITGQGSSAIFGSAFNELSLDSVAVATSQEIPVARAIYKGGQLQMSLILKGFETTDEFANMMQSAALKKALESEFGIQFCC